MRIALVNTVSVPEPPITAQALEAPRCSNCEEELEDCSCHTCDNCDSIFDTVCGNCDRCESCCNCGRCRRCSCRTDDICSNCDRCIDSCCSCNNCGSCGPTSNNICSGCDNCTECCDCSDDINYHQGELKFFPASKTEFKLNTSKRYISLEVEVNRGDSYLLAVVIAKYDDSIVEDGSLGDNGWELNSNPSQGDVFITHVDDIAKAMYRANADVNHRCGMHCHIDARNYSWFDFYKLLQLYPLIEDLVFSLVSPDRLHNSYSQPCASLFNHFSTYKTFKLDMLRHLYGYEHGGKSHCPRPMLALDPSRAHKNSKSKQVLAGRTNKYGGSNRYSALNINSFFYRRTIEFRHHEGCIDADEMKNWGMFCAAIIDAGSRMTLHEIGQLSNLNRVQQLYAIAPKHLWSWGKSKLGN